MDKVWAYISHKDGYWAGIASADMGSGLGKWIADSIRRGFCVTSVKDRDAYNVALSELKPWHESPEWKAKHCKKPQA